MTTMPATTTLPVNIGFSMAEIAELVSLWNNRRRASASVKRIAQKHADELAAGSVSSPSSRSTSIRTHAAR
jgi:MerR family transcriptional regulator, copper efflux regulator